MKRVTYWPQGWLGLAMNWGLPTAWLAASPNDVESLPMWALTFGTFWFVARSFDFPVHAHHIIAGRLSTTLSMLAKIAKTM